MRSVVSAFGLIWLVHYLFRLRTGKHHPLDRISLLMLAYGVMNMVVFKKTKTHYFEVAHCAVAGIYFPQTVDGVKIFRLNTWRPYVSGFADAMTYVNKNQFRWSRRSFGKKTTCMPRLRALQFRNTRK